jgi:TonB family protein
MKKLFVICMMFGMTLSMYGESREVKTRVSPVYPELAKRMKISGAVKVDATVDASGNVLSVNAVEGNRMLGPAAEEAVKKWKFVASDRTSVVSVTLNFALAQ